MTRVVAEMYRIENVIYVRIKAVGELQLGATAKLLHYRRHGWSPPAALIGEPALDSSSPLEPARV